MSENELPAAFAEFVQNSKVIQEFFGGKTWGDVLRDRLFQTDPHWDVVAWNEYPNANAVALVTRTPTAGADLFVFKKGEAQERADLDYWSVDHHYDTMLPHVAVYWHHLGDGGYSNSEEGRLLPFAITTEEENILQLI